MTLSVYFLIPLFASLVSGLGFGLLTTPVVALWDTFASNHVRELSGLGQTVGMDDRRNRFLLRIWGGGFVVICVGVFLLFGSWILIPITGYLWYKCPRWIYGLWVARRQRLFRDQLDPACSALANTVRAGLSLAQGLELVGQESPHPIKGELLGLVRQVNLGRPLTQALQDSSRHVNLPGYRMVCTALQSCLEHGGPVTDTLDGIARAVRENQKIERRMDTLTAGGRMTLIVLAIFPVGFFLANYAIVPEIAMSYPGTLAGQVTLSAVAAMIYVSLKWGQSIMRVDSLK